MPQASLLARRFPRASLHTPGARRLAGSVSDRRKPAAVAAAPHSSMLEERKTYISGSIRQVPDFPKKGILFHDVTTLLLDPKVRPETATQALQLLLTKYALCTQHVR